MPKSKLTKVENTNIKLKNCPPKAKIKVYYENKESRGVPVGNNRNKVTLSQRMDKFESALVLISKNLTLLNQKIDNGFKQANTRLDYIVKANNLKDLPESEN